MATQQQVQHLQELFGEVSQTNHLLVNEALRLKEIVSEVRGSQHRILSYLTSTSGPKNTSIDHPIPSVAILRSDDRSALQLHSTREMLASCRSRCIFQS